MKRGRFPLSEAHNCIIETEIVSLEKLINVGTNELLKTFIIDKKTFKFQCY